MSHLDSHIRIPDDVLKLHSQINDGPAYELDNERFQEVQAHWESFGPVTLDEPEQWLRRLRSTAELCDRLLSPGTWLEIVWAHVEYRRAIEFIASEAQRGAWNRIQQMPAGPVRQAAMKRWWARYWATEGGLKP